MTIPKWPACLGERLNAITVALPAGLTFSSVVPSEGGSCSGTTTVICIWSAVTTPGTSRSLRIAANLTAAPGSNVGVNATAASAVTTTDASALVNIGAASAVITPIPVNDSRSLMLLVLLMLTIGSLTLRRPR